MRGSPLLLTAFLALGLLLAGIPVWSLTRPHPHTTPAPASTTVPPAHVRPFELKVTTTTAATIELRHAGQVVWSSSAPAESFDATLSAASGLTDFVASIRWLDGSKANAARFQFSRDGDTLADLTLWGELSTEDVLTVPAAP